MSSDYLHSVIKFHKVRYSSLTCPSELFVTFSEDKIRPSDSVKRSTTQRQSYECILYQSIKLCNFWFGECEQNGPDQKAIMENTSLAEIKRTKHDLNVVWTHH